MARGVTRDAFDNARLISCIALVIAGALGAVGAYTDWVVIEPPPIVPESQLDQTRPFSGVDAGDGWWVIGASAVFVVAAIVLWLRPRRGVAWLAFVAAMIGGGVVVADYRGIGDITSSLSQRVDLVGDASPALGIALAAAGMIGGLLAASAALVAIPRTTET